MADQSAKLAFPSRRGSESSRKDAKPQRSLFVIPDLIGNPSAPVIPAKAGTHTLEAKNHYLGRNENEPSHRRADEPFRRTLQRVRPPGRLGERSLRESSAGLERCRSPLRYGEAISGGGLSL